MMLHKISKMRKCCWCLQSRQGGYGELLQIWPLLQRLDLLSQLGVTWLPHPHYLPESDECAATYFIGVLMGLACSWSTVVTTIKTPWTWWTSGGYHPPAFNLTKACAKLVLVTLNHFCFVVLVLSWGQRVLHTAAVLCVLRWPWDGWALVQVVALIGLLTL